MGVCWRVITYFLSLTYLELRHGQQQSWSRLLPPAVYHHSQTLFTPFFPGTKGRQTVKLLQQTSSSYNVVCKFRDLHKHMFFCDI